jgi:hypothetical protein
MPYAEARGIAQQAMDNKDTNTCDQLKEANKKDWCYWIVALSSNNLQLCDKIGLTVYRDGCYMGMAISSNTVSICDSLKRVDNPDKFATQNRCRALVNGDLSVCDTITRGTGGQVAEVQRAQKDGCYLTVAVALKDMSMCDKLVDSLSKNLCVSEVKARY